MPRIKSAKPKIKIKEIKSKVKVSAVSTEDGKESLEEELEDMPSRSLDRMPVSRARSSPNLEMQHGSQVQTSFAARRTSPNAEESSVRYAETTSRYAASPASSSTYATRVYDAPASQRSSSGGAAPILTSEREIIPQRERAVGAQRGIGEPSSFDSTKKYQEIQKGAAGGARKKYPWEV